MSLINYWPLPENIAQCIRTEAEELAEHVLLAVHEPMQLQRVGGGEDELCSEEDLLKHFLLIERPIPIIGRSGVGKSHLIRWLHAQLKLHPASADWHIVRIPKNASLRQVLDILLKDLEGESFTQARAKVSQVSERLNTHEVAELLLTFMAQQLRHLNRKIAEIVEVHRANGTRPDAKEEVRLKEIYSHTSKGAGLSELIQDSYFRLSLLKPDHCIYQFASRLTEGASNDELSRNSYQINAQDLDFNFNLDDLASNAKRYVSQAQLNTSAEARETAARVLSEVLGESTRKAFQQLFQFSGGSFQDLFKEIRRSLKQQNRTLVVLVEDMAAISAIEDVLIDSLLEESMRDGEQGLCTLRSAIAVTNGYQGYLRRQDTIKTRAQYEWHIREHGQDGEETLERIVDFCGRYLNAARHGSEALKSSWLVREKESWPSVWSDSDDDSDDLNSFGYAPCQVPLFPFNRNAIAALSDSFCRKGEGELKFNPRQVLNEVLLRTLRDYRDLYLENRFPPAGFAGISISAGLGSLQRLDEPERSKTTAAIWGYNSRSIEELQSKLDRKVPKAFGLDGLALLLKDGVVTSVAVPANLISEEASRAKQSAPRVKLDPDQTRLDQLEDTVTSWFQRKQKLGQDDARDLRAGLLRIYDLHTKKRYKHLDWLGLKELPSLLSGSRPLIELPYAEGNLALSRVQFFLDMDFEVPEKAAFLQGVTLALLRYEHFNRKPPLADWQYTNGFEDYLICQTFAARWVPDVLQTLAVEAQQALSGLLGLQLQSAMTLGLLAGCSNDRERLNELLQTTEKIREIELPSVVPELKSAREQVLEDWDAQREAWLKLVSANFHGMDGYLVLKAIRIAKITPESKLVKLAKNIVMALQPAVSAVEVLDGCSRYETFCGLLDEMIELVHEISNKGRHYPLPQVDLPNAKKLQESLANLKDSKSWDVVKGLLALRAEVDVVKRLEQVNRLDGKQLEQVLKVLGHWKIVYGHALACLVTENIKWGGETLTNAQNAVTDLFDDLSVTLDKLQEMSHDCA
ncbi:protein DpdH [Pseudomonas shahriarae]|uniref:protein DpdH n=1 Tax=Pseudomonas shahriarae TaxID=2745512 RepID=UPI00235F2BB3|nr:protein DpdH [Pseudomonas shahriarae]MDD0981118.1 ATP-binding protein [Pseudomonas shahriarae]